MPPASVSNMMYHNDSRDILRMRQQQQHSVQMEKHAQAQAAVQAQVVRDSLHGRPVVWRWVPFTAQHGAAGYIPPATSSMNPRVIYATAKKIEGGSNSEELPALLTGGELQQAREVLIQNKVDSLVSAVTTAPSTTPAALRIPQVTVPPSMIPRHDELAGQNPLLHKAKHMPPPPPSQVPNHGKDEASNSGAGGDLEVANLLLNMGGSAKSEDSAKKKKETSNSDKLSPMKKLLTPKPNKAPIPPPKPPAFQDIYLENWVGGSVSLHTPEDDDVLSPLHCFMRRYCVEAFSATAEDVATPRYGKSHGFKVEIGQVGIRCLHCKDSPAGKRAERAVCYPSSLRNIYHSIETWQRRHSLVCKEITPWVRKSILELMESSKTRAGGRRQYWEDSAR